jgi:serine/threonine protein kinase
LDISLENVLVSSNGALKLSDFGVAHYQDEKHISTQNGAFTRPGKLMYISPECLVLDKFDGFKADVYSLEVLLFCMLYGFNPYTRTGPTIFRDFCEGVGSTNTEEFPMDDNMDFLHSSNLVYYSSMVRLVHDQRLFASEQAEGMMLSSDFSTRTNFT